ncbi:hypothetical protein N7448_001871 [Penicillium atrosanguineum]|uniref:Carnitinyl-CoA dehydratase n=1 Tax=Penicillium atrosanguineum TaxID=1132637 RepID=A0A9W9QA28_9EURO|nr:uncharacterized protein N7443_005269 [Penicillium atrosanguineum]KAJ5133100.1 hypothetical protein N7526_004465 [Penicillium atrosanguineum]KAJ5150293.1 hypothetical protein N7448_001871 [Penicillium atrosanguineum]KAJ5305609.1 hypothetical protein N7443_005269 [Penicillium atrosanguineum]KAJ5325071.1 hypothetical protein N7476_003671 [Penicillium atrosanguineum]
MADSLHSQPPVSKYFQLSFPQPGVILVTINREQQRNSLPSDAHWDGHNLFTWFDEEPTLLVAVVTGAGEKAFCAGQDLAEQNASRRGPKTAEQMAVMNHPPSGFMGLSQRRGKKPVLAAVNGFALGGGFEICLNCDMVVASPEAQFGLPEVAVGLYAAAGGLPRVIRIVGLQLASELAMTGRRLSAQEALEWRLINRVAKTPASVVEECLDLAGRITSFSPDGIIVSRQGLREGWENPSVEQATSRTRQEYVNKLVAGENFKIGVEAFARKTRPKWVPSRL